MTSDSSLLITGAAKKALQKGNGDCGSEAEKRGMRKRRGMENNQNSESHPIGELLAAVAGNGRVCGDWSS